MKNARPVIISLVGGSVGLVMELELLATGAIG